MKLFNKNFNDITYDDVEELVRARAPETEVLDWKLDFDSKQTSKLVCAMANTYGGFIIYGVPSDEQMNTPLPIEGVTKTGLEDSVDSLCFDSITPPVFCERAYLDSQDTSKRVFVVRVPESDLTPHAVDNNSTVYVKVRAQKRPLLRKANLDELGFLLQRRQKSVETRERVVSYCREVVQNVSKDVAPTHSEATIDFVPRFPRKSLIPINELREFADNWINDFRRHHPASIIGINNATHFDGGLVIKAENPENQFEMTIAVHELGYSSVRATFHRFGEPDPKYLRAEEPGLYYLLGFDLADRFYRKSMFRGQLLVESRLSGIKGTKLYTEFPRGASLAGFDSKTNQLTPSASFQAVFNSGLRLDEARGFVLNMLSRVIFLYGVAGDTHDYARFCFDHSKRLYFQQTRPPDIVSAPKDSLYCKLYDHSQ